MIYICDYMDELMSKPKKKKKVNVLGVFVCVHFAAVAMPKTTPICKGSWPCVSMLLSRPTTTHVCCLPASLAWTMCSASKR